MSEPATAVVSTGIEGFPRVVIDSPSGCLHARPGRHESTVRELRIERGRIHIGEILELQGVPSGQRGLEGQPPEDPRGEASGGW